MKWQDFQYRPNSLVTHAKTVRERESSMIQNIVFDFTTGECSVQRNNGGGYSASFNIYNDSILQFQKTIGTENLWLVNAIQKIGRTEFQNNNVGYLSIEFQNVNGIQRETPDCDVISWDRMIGGSSSVYLDSEIMNSLFANITKLVSVPATEQSIQYGDNEKPSSSVTGRIDFQDYLVGGQSIDEIYGLLGNDTLEGLGGNDFLYGGYGRDVLLGGDGNDNLYGEQSNDSIMGGNGNDIIDGGLGIDTMRGGDGNDRYLIDNINDVIIDDKGIDIVLIPLYLSFVLPKGIEQLRMTGNEDSRGTGNELANTLIGNEGDNFLDGAIGNDIVNGGTGVDTLTGGKGTDTLSGGNGADIFKYQHVTESDIVNANAFDMIKDFNLSEGDKIDLSAMDAKSGGTANDMFSFYSTAPKTAGASSNGAVWFSNGFLFASNDTDIQAEFKVAMNGVSSINASNIIL